MNDIISTQPWQSFAIIILVLPPQTQFNILAPVSAIIFQKFIIVLLLVLKPHLFGRHPTTTTIGASASALQSDVHVGRQNHRAARNGRRHGPAD
jgi:hypothetical protein